MSLSTTDAVNAVFKNAVQEHLQKSLRTGEDWDRFKDIQRETDARLMQEQSAYKYEFPQRMAEAKEIILREQHSVRLDQPLPPGVDAQSNATDLDRIAGERVKHDHDHRLAIIKKDEFDHFRDLTADIRDRDAPTPVRQQFQDRTQFRSGPTQT